MNDSPKILIIRLSSLGDILHTLPAFASLRASFPKGRIDWLVGAKFSFLLSAVRGIDTVHTVDTSRLLRLRPDTAAWRQIMNLIHSLQRQRYDFSLDFQGLLKTAFLSLMSGASTRIGFSKDLVREFPAHWFYDETLDKPPEQIHVLGLNRRLAELTGARAEPGPLDLVAPEDDARLVNSLLTRERLTDYVVINPGGGWPSKVWQPQRYGALAERILAERGLEVIVTTGPGEEVLYEAIAAHSGKASPRHFRLTFLQLIPLLKRARLLIGGDTGPFHLACALGAPVVGIFGPTSPVRNGPWSDGNEVICRSLPCSFCHKRRCPINNECMDIPVDDVFAAVIRQLDKTQTSCKESNVKVLSDSNSGHAISD